jgi:acyl-CoA synthetase (AMP-forming)/AMP-acid ligase II
MRVIDYFDKAVETYAERTALVHGASHYSYRATGDLSRRLAHALIERGMTTGDRVAIYAPNDPRVVFCLLATMRIGAPWSPINPLWTLETNIAFMRQIGATWLFADREYREGLDAIRREVPTLAHVVCFDESFDALMRDGPETISDATDDETLHWADACGDADRLVALMPTGGTTGTPKAVLSRMLSYSTRIEVHRQRFGYDDTDPVCLVASPLMRVGLFDFALFTLGAAHVIMRKFTALDVLANIERHRVTHLFLAPAGLYALLDHPRVGDFDYSSLRYFVLGGSPVAPDRLKIAVDLFGPCLCQSYGQTEAPRLAWLDPATVADAAAGHQSARLSSCGVASDPAYIAVMGDDGTLLRQGCRGEIVVRGKLVSPGYLDDPAATAAAHTKGWHRTGDIGYLDDEGYIYLVDRKKDLIITGGVNVYSVEVEACLMELAAVRECAVIGVPDARWGEAVQAVVVLREGETIEADAIVAHCKRRLGSVKAPKSIERRGELPRTAAGKIDKRALRASAWAGTDRSIH